MKQYMTPRELAEMFRMTYWSIMHWKRQGKLPYLKIGRKTLFDVEDVKALIEKYKKEV